MAVGNGESPSSSRTQGRPQQHPERQPRPRLACGREAARVWEHAATGRLDAHEQTCPYCQAVAADQAGLAGAARELAADPLEPPPGLLERAMGVVRAELHHEYLPLPARYGPARVEAGSAAGVLRHAVDQMTGVRARSCRITLPDEQPNPTPENDSAPPADRPPGAVVQLTLAVAFGADLLSVAARAQQMILAAADELLGLPVEVVDVEVVDIFLDPAHPAGDTGRSMR